MPVFDAELGQRLRYELKNLEYTKGIYEDRLEKLRDCEGAFLRRSRNHNSCYYYSIKRRDASAYKYLGKSNHVEVKRVREAWFLKEAARRIDHDIDLIKALMNGYLSYDASSVSEGLPDLYRCEVPPVSELYARESAKWLQRRLDFQKQHPENYPRSKRHRASDGVWVKTISELTVYEMLKAAGFAVIYELPFPPEDHGPNLYPDFTVLSPVDMKTEIIVEFAGRMDRREYREDFAKRVGRYIENGFIPGVNLFFIFSDKDGNIDSMQIKKVIDDIRGMSIAAA